MTKILIVEDDAHIREGLVAALAGEGYETETAENGRIALDRVRAAPPHLLLLDIMMPEVSGYDVCRAVRTEYPGLPVIMLTAKGEEFDKVLGLTLGADDYISKPFGIRELVARVAAVLRRSLRSSDERSAMEGETFAFGGTQVDLRRSLAVHNGQQTPLTEKEIQLLRLFHAHPEEVLTRDRILNAVWGINYLGNTRTLDQHISLIRKKLPDPSQLETVHWQGYRWRGH
jgi:DNA-binding response OmpR family regulator